MISHRSQTGDEQRLRCSDHEEFTMRDRNIFFKGQRACLLVQMQRVPQAVFQEGERCIDFN